jgi:hypothetical protein
VAFAARAGRGEPALFDGAPYRVGLIAGAEDRQDPLYPRGDGRAADTQLLGYLLVGQALREQSQDGVFRLGQLTLPMIRVGWNPPVLTWRAGVEVTERSVTMLEVVCRIGYPQV